MTRMIRIAIRGSLKGVKVFESRIELPEERLETLLSELAEEHAAAMCRGQLGMIEIEFLDEPDPLDRFFRFGVESAGMVMPWRLRL